jgi:hypothetical protein
MSNKMKFRLGDRDVLGELVPIQNTQESWNQYLLQDGSLLKMKMVVTDIYRVEGEFDPEGNPVYMVKSSQIMSVNAPDDLKRK